MKGDNLFGAHMSWDYKIAFPQITYPELKEYVLKGLWQGLEIARIEIYHSADVTVPLVIMGVAAKILFLSWAALPIITMAAGVVVSRVALKLAKNLPENPGEVIREEVDKLNHRYPRLYIIATLISVAAGYYFVLLSFLASLLTGCYIGVKSTILVELPSQVPPATTHSSI